jgi:hypothetical protein
MLKVSGVHSFQKPVGGNLVPGSPLLCFGVDSRADCGELKTDA